jgi:uncharacterized protein with FMN-binding domain
MKRSFGFVLSLLFFIAGCAVFGSGSRVQQEVAQDSVYEGIGRGYRGPVQVQVRMESGSFTAIDIIDSREDPSVGGAAMEELLDLVIAYNTTDLDAISGATESSKGFLEAVENAIVKYE